MGIPDCLFIALACCAERVASDAANWASAYGPAEAETPTGTESPRGYQGKREWKGLFAKTTERLAQLEFFPQNARKMRVFQVCQVCQLARLN